MAISTRSAGIGALHRYFSQSRRRIYILPTTAGMLYGITLMVMLLGAINYDNSLAYGLTFLIGSLMPVAILHTYRNLARLELDCAAPAAVFAGEPIRLPVVLDNRRQPARIAIDVRYLDNRRRFWQKPVGVINTALAADSLHTIELPLPAMQRGVYTLAGLRVASSFPLGLFRTWSHFRCGQTAVVYPHPAGALPLPAVMDYQGDDPIGQLSGTDDFLGFRGYRPGDSMRSVDWKAAARGEELLVKRFSGSGSRQIDLHWDATRRLGDTEARLSQLCRWVVDAERLGWRYRLRLPGLEFPLENGPQHRNICLQALARFGH